ncbi:MAG: TA system VapC family ribonuclease toxin [Acidobacteriota bacterium]
MKTALLDVNLLIALLWPAHVHHAAAHQWFGRRGSRDWATCPITQLAFVRIVSNPAFSRDALAIRQAFEVLEKNLRHKGHRFWPDDLEVVGSVAASSEKIVGHRQLTDAYLLALASARHGVLASFDSGLQSIASSDQQPFLEIVRCGS